MLSGAHAAPRRQVSTWVNAVTAKVSTRIGGLAILPFYHSTVLPFCRSAILSFFHSSPEFAVHLPSEPETSIIDLGVLFFGHTS
jgi:hypothetical protein